MRKTSNEGNEIVESSTTILNYELVCKSHSQNEAQALFKTWRALNLRKRQGILRKPSKVQSLKFHQRTIKSNKPHTQVVKKWFISIWEKRRIQRSIPSLVALFQWSNFRVPLTCLENYSLETRKICLKTPRWNSNGRQYNSCLRIKSNRSKLYQTSFHRRRWLTSYMQCLKIQVVKSFKNCEKRCLTTSGISFVYTK